MNLSELWSTAVAAQTRTLNDTAIFAGSHQRHPAPRRAKTRVSSSKLNGSDTSDLQWLAAQIREATTRRALGELSSQPVLHSMCECWRRKTFQRLGSAATPVD